MELALHTFQLRNLGVQITKCNFSMLLKEAWENALLSRNICAGFRNAGIYPLDRDKIQPTIENEDILTDEDDHGHDDDHIDGDDDHNDDGDDDHIDDDDDDHIDGDDDHIDGDDDHIDDGDDDHIDDGDDDHIDDDDDLLTSPKMIKEAGKK